MTKRIMESVGILFATLLVIAQPALADDKGYVTGSLEKVQAQQKKTDALPQVLIKNVNVFDGKSDNLAMGQDILVEGNLIKMEPAMTSPLALIHASSRLLVRWVAERQFNITGG